jgi:serine/threonine protein kinase/Flp pilus assembly protein TadD/TolB-like protein
MVGRTVSHYHVQEKLGGGGMGVVYRAEDTRLGRSVALKFLTENLAHDARHLERFKVEARASSALSDPHICSIHDVGEFEGQPYLVMEFLEGETLKERVGGSQLPLGEAVGYAIEVARGLEAAHAKGVIHRDLKPGNIFLTVEGRIKILDFGLAKLVRTEPHDTAASAAPTFSDTLTGTGMQIGTVGYMSPEQVEGGGLDGRSDLFSLGVVLYQLCTGQTPFAGANAVAVMNRILNHQPPPPSSLNGEIPADLERIILRLLEKRPATRYQSAEELRVDLEGVRHRLDATGESPTRPLGSSRSRKLLRRLGPVLRSAVPILLLVVIALLLARRFDWYAIPDQKHLVVLPFTCMGTDEARGGFCDGLVEILTSRLTRLEQPAGSLLVVPASEVFSEGITNAAQARRRFGVNLAVSGIVWSRSEGVQVALNLIDIRRGRQIRSAETVSTREETSALVEWAVAEVAAMIQLGVSPDILTVLAAGASGVPQAEDFHIQGRGYLSRTDRPGNIDLAIGLFERALALDPSYARGHAALGEAYWEKYAFTYDARWIEKATASVLRALDLDPELAEARVTLGRVYRGTGRYEDAVREFLGVVASHPADAYAHLRLARAYESLGDVERAETTHKRAIELRAGDWKTHQELGYFYYFQGRIPEAVKAFEHARDLTPDNHHVYNDLGACYIVLGRRDEAERAFLKSIDAEPNFMAYSNLGTMHFQEGDFQRAAELYEEAAELDEGNYEVWGNLGAARRGAGGGDAADDAYGRAAELAAERHAIDPRDPLVAAHLAVYYAELGRREESRALLDEVAESALQNHFVLHHAVNAYETMGDREEALAWLRRGVERGYRLDRIEASPAFGALRSDEGYRRLKAEIEGKGKEDQK